MGKKFSEWIKNNYRNIIISALVFVPFFISLISTVHVVNFFRLSNYGWMAVTLAIAFEIGALSSLAALAVMDKINKTSLWIIFVLITLMQMMGNTYYAFDFIANQMKNGAEWTQNWIELFGIQNESVPVTKRILAIISGAILPIISLTFLHMLVTYISKTRTINEDDYEYVTVDENGNEIVVDEIPVHDQTVKTPVEVIKPDITPDKTVQSPIEGIKTEIQTLKKTFNPILKNTGISDLVSEINRATKREMKAKRVEPIIEEPVIVPEPVIEDVVDNSNYIYSDDEFQHEITDLYDDELSKLEDNLPEPTEEFTFDGEHDIPIDEIVTPDEPIEDTIDELNQQSSNPQKKRIVLYKDKNRTIYDDVE